MPSKMHEKESVPPMIEADGRTSPVSRLACILLGALSAVACQHGRAQTVARDPQAVEVANLRAFAKLYGVLRWFHPSDAAAATDWDRFADVGVRSVATVTTLGSRRSALQALVRAIAPTVQLADPGVRFTEPTTASGEGPAQVAWEHRGYGDSLRASVYASKRRGRERMISARGASVSVLSQKVDASQLRGKRVRLRGKIRVSQHARGQLWLRADRGNSSGFFDNMDDRPVTSRTWTTAEIVGTVDEDATTLAFGTLLTDAGPAWFDDLSLAVETPPGTWSAIAIQDPGFEAAQPLAAWTSGIGRGNPLPTDGWTLVADPSLPAEGRFALRVERLMEATTDELFGDAPGHDEALTLELGDGLRARVPISLPSSLAASSQLDPRYAPGAAGHAPAGHATYDPLAGVSDVVVVWNVFQHFWPYWSTVSVDWEAVLEQALRRALADRTVDQHVETLEQLTAAIPDGHISVACPDQAKLGFPPFSVKVVEGSVVVTGSRYDAVERGDLVIQVDGRSASREIEAQEQRISGSPQWRRYQAEARFGAGLRDTVAVLQLRRAGRLVEVKTSRGDPMPTLFARAPIERLDDGIYYVDLSRVSTGDLTKAMESLASAPGVIFDVRRTPNVNDSVLSHLLTRADTDVWLAVPRIIRPNHTADAVARWDATGWNLTPAAPHIAGRVAFMTGPGAISYAESIMGFVEGYHLGTIVGSATAGTNGNIAEIGAPTGCRVRFTGVRATKHDGSQHHGIGITPTIVVVPTIAGIAAGRDEVFERALADVRDRAP